MELGSLNFWLRLLLAVCLSIYNSEGTLPFKDWSSIISRSQASHLRRGTDSHHNQSERISEQYRDLSDHHESEKKINLSAILDNSEQINPDLESFQEGHVNIFRDPNRINMRIIKPEEIQDHLADSVSLPLVEDIWSRKLPLVEDVGNIALHLNDDHSGTNASVSHNNSVPTRQSERRRARVSNRHGRVGIQLKSFSRGQSTLADQSRPRNRTILLPVEGMLHKRTKLQSDHGSEKVLHPERSDVWKGPYVVRLQLTKNAHPSDKIDILEPVKSTGTSHPCIKCPSDQRLTLKKNENYISVTIPSISICPSLAKSPGKVHVAMTSGPPPGTKVKEGEYRMELLVWKANAKIAVCEYILKVDAFKNSTSDSKCEKPPDIEYGLLLCGSQSKHGIYPTGTICQYFCHPGYKFSSEVKNNGLLVCKGNTWSTKEKVSCVAQHCSKPSEPPPHGYLQCLPIKDPDHLVKKPGLINSGIKYSSGIICRYLCEIGYVIPTSQIHRSIIQCLAPNWNSTEVPDCKQKISAYSKCKNLTVIAKRGMVKVKKPRFYSVNGKRLKVKCSLKGKLALGSYENYCETVDPELRETVNCTYTITVKDASCPRPQSIKHGDIKCYSPSPKKYYPSTVCEYTCHKGYSIPASQQSYRIIQCLSDIKWNATKTPQCWQIVPPKPHPKDCTDKIFITNREATRIKKTRFILPNKRILKVKCSIHGWVNEGYYNNYCRAKDPETGLTANCTYSITVKVRRCPSPQSIKNGDFICTSEPNAHFPSTLCTYFCNSGYGIPVSQMKYQVQQCLPHLQWNATVIPKCIKLVPPVPEPGYCHQTTVNSINEALEPEKPKFSSPVGNPVKVSCITIKNSELNQFDNYCEAMDEEMRISASCNYTIKVSEALCPTPPEPGKNGAVKCPDNGSYPHGIVCEYVCDEGFIIPNSQMDKIWLECLKNSSWNVTEAPICKKQFPPTHSDSSCVDQVIASKNLPVVLEPPLFFTANQKSAETVCNMDKLESYGTHSITCTANDTELKSNASCTFNVTIEHEKGNKCHQLTAPTNGIIVCSSNATEIFCTLNCKEGFNFPSDLQLLHQGYVKCDLEDEMWDFQKEHDITDLPDCLRELPSTVLERSLKFQVESENCSTTNEQNLSEKIQELLLSINNETCSFMNCSYFHFNCFHQEENQISIWEIIWTLKALFAPSFNDEYEVPEAETNIEQIGESVRKMVSSDENFKEVLLKEGFKVKPDSFSQGLIMYKCEKAGYTVDFTDKCVECSSGTYEKNAECVLCDENHYQDMTGETSCKSCPENSNSPRGSKSSSMCKLTS